MSANASQLLSGAGVPVAPCPSCEREVVAYLVDVTEANEHYACTRCDRPLRGVSLRDEADLGDLGYAVTDPLAAGCATGCASGGCGARPRTIDDILALPRKL